MNEWMNLLSCVRLNRKQNTLNTGIFYGDKRRFLVDQGNYDRNIVTYCVFLIWVSWYTQADRRTCMHTYIHTHKQQYVKMLCICSLHNILGILYIIFFGRLHVSLYISSNLCITYKLTYLITRPIKAGIYFSSRLSHAARRDSSSHVSACDKKILCRNQSPTNHSPPWAHVAIQHCAIWKCARAT